MWVAFVVNISNIAVSLLLVLGFGLKVEGVASGTDSPWLGRSRASALCESNIALLRDGFVK